MLQNSDSAERLYWMKRNETGESPFDNKWQRQMLWKHVHDPNLKIIFPLPNSPDFRIHWEPIQRFKKVPRCHDANETKWKELRGIYELQLSPWESLSFSYLIVTKREPDFHRNPMWRQSVGEYCRRRDEGKEQLVLHCILFLFSFSIYKSVCSSCPRNLLTRDSEGPTCRSARRNAVKVTICGVYNILRLPAESQRCTNSQNQP